MSDTAPQVGAMEQWGEAHTRRNGWISRTDYFAFARERDAAYAAGDPLEPEEVG